MRRTTNHRSFFLHFSIFRSEFFEVALTKDWLEKKDRKMDLKDCSAEALDVAVNFMYGIKVPDQFTQLCHLLHLSELFMMENLTEVVVQRLTKEVTKDNYLEVSQTAELFSKENLINKCAVFLYEHENVEWDEMAKLPKVMAAFGKLHVVMKKKNAFKKRAPPMKREKRVIPKREVAQPPRANLEEYDENDDEIMDEDEIDDQQY